MVVTYKTHLATALAVTLPVMIITNTLEISAIAAVSLGCLAPDIDEPRSWIGRRTRGLSDFIGRMFGHRGMTHSIIGLAVATLFVGIPVLHFEFPHMPLIYFALGYFLHLLSDSFSKSGIPWLWPLKKRFQSGRGKFYYITGDRRETIVFAISLIAISATFLFAT